MKRKILAVLTLAGMVNADMKQVQVDLMQKYFKHADKSEKYIILSGEKAYFFQNNALVDEIKISKIDLAGKAYKITPDSVYEMDDIAIKKTKCCYNTYPVKKYKGTNGLLYSSPSNIDAALNICGSYVIVYGSYTCNNNNW